MMTDAPAGRSARIDILHVGSLRPGVTSTCTLVRDARRAIVFDPGMVERQDDLLRPLAALGLAPADVSDVVLSHHHPDHCLNAGLFPRAAVHDHWAVYRGAEWDSVDAEGRELTAAVRLIRVPGHTPEDIALVAGTSAGTWVLTHLWWTADGPAEDPYAPDREELRRSRQRVLAVADRVVPGHGPGFVPTDATPR
jgi:glyoxylase-like metal-dependent hydrolase (beta-lactamase superfamily II)